VTAELATEPLQFTLIISEKGGAERRQVFQTPEITLGRVQGNHLVLPKGNISKRHARILFREGRFIVADLNSTNGTYVNRRRIAQATLIREEDRIYIGDFVLRLQANVPEDHEEEETPSETGAHEISGTPTIAPEPDGAQHHSSTSWERLTRTDEIAQSSLRPPSANTISSAPPRDLSFSARRPHLATDALQETSNSVQRFLDMASGHRLAVKTTVLNVLEHLGFPEVEPSDHYCEQARLRIEETVDALLVDGQIPVGTSAEAVADQAIDELVGLGPLGELLDDPAVSSISAARFDEITGTRDGRQQSFPPGFSLAQTLELALKRICAASGQLLGDDAVEEHKLTGGTRISIVRGEVSPSGPLVHIRKPRKIACTLDDLVRRGAISRAMATFLGQCVAGQLNVLVVGPADEGAHVVLSALCSATANERLVAVSEFDDVTAHSEGAVQLELSRYQGDLTRLLEIAASIPQTRLVATLTSPELATATLEATGRGMGGLLASLPAVNLSRGLLRLPADIVSVRKTMSLEAATGWVLSAFDVVLEVARLRDGRIRALRIAELSRDATGAIQINDIFRFVISRVAAGGAVEGSFSASGTEPRVASQLKALGMKLDSSIFIRPSST